MADSAERVGSTGPTPKHRILFLAHRPLTDASFGGGQRTSHIRSAAGEVGLVDTLVIHCADARHTSRSWDEQRTLTLAFRCAVRRPGALLDRLWVRRRVLEVIRSGNYDVVIARYLSTGLTVPRRYRNRLVLDADDIVKTPVRSGAALGGAVAIARSALRETLVRHVMGQVAHVWFVNPRDLTTLGPRAASASLLSNAAITYEGTHVKREPGSMMIVGHYEHAPNREAVEFLLNEVMPDLRESWPGVVLRIVGSVPADSAEKWSSAPDVQVLGFVEDLGAEYARTALALVPVHSGGGTQIKLIEALANGCPTVASRFAHAGFARTVEVDHHLFVAGSAQEWVGMCQRAFEDPASSEAMARAAAEVVRRTHGVAAMQEHVRQTVLALLGEGGRPSPSVKPPPINQCEPR